MPTQRNMNECSSPFSRRKSTGTWRKDEPVARPHTPDQWSIPNTSLNQDEPRHASPILRPPSFDRDSLPRIKNNNVRRHKSKTLRTFNFLGDRRANQIKEQPCKCSICNFTQTHKKTSMLPEISRGTTPDLKPMPKFNRVTDSHVKNTANNNQTDAIQRSRGRQKKKVWSEELEPLPKGNKEENVSSSNNGEVHRTHSPLPAPISTEYRPRSSTRESKETPETSMEEMEKDALIRPRPPVFRKKSAPTMGISVADAVIEIARARKVRRAQQTSEKSKK